MCLFLAAAIGCGPPSVEQLCEEVAAEQCAACYACEIDGATACGLRDGASEDACQQEMAGRCEDQAATLERPKVWLDDCSASLGELTCDVLVRAAVQGAPHTTDACTYFF